MKRYKYPRTPHLLWSPGIDQDDIRHTNLSFFQDRQVIVTEKMDGENTTMYCDYIHARSIDSSSHPSRDWIKKLHATFCFNIPAGWRLCGENLYAKHSISYDNLESFFYLFSVWNEYNECLSWDETLHWAKVFNVPVPKVLYSGPWDLKCIKNLTIDTQACEGYVVRLAGSFHYEEFDQSMAKWVRKNHIQTQDTWKHSKIISNKLKKERQS